MKLTELTCDDFYIDLNLEELFKILEFTIENEIKFEIEYDNYSNFFMMIDKGGINNNINKRKFIKKFPELIK